MQRALEEALTVALGNVGVHIYIYILYIYTHNIYICIYIYRLRFRIQSFSGFTWGLQFTGLNRFGTLAPKFIEYCMGMHGL